MSESTQNSTCPDAATLRALLDGTLLDDQQTATQAHVDRCPICEAALRQMTAGSESWIGMAANLKRGGDGDPQLAAALNRLKADDGSGGNSSEPADPQRTLEFLQPTDDPKLLGKLGRHEISEVIGWGGMGVVLKAYDPSLHRVVAVKVLASHLAHHAVARKRFIREAQAAAAVCHDNVVTIHAIEEAAGSGDPRRAPLPKIVMQFVAGGSLQERIDAEGPLELKEILRIALQTAAGLAAAHAQGVVHRDVKPANILLENGVQRVKLTDFGLARVMDDASLTLSGVIAGTPQYMAPEQAWGRDVDARADLFSLGAVMYAMCTGHSPFRARTTMAVLKRVCDDSPRSLRAINPDIPEWLCAIIDKLLAKKPEDRFQSATEVSELLSRWLAHVQQPNVVPIPERIASVPGRSGRVSERSSLADMTAKSARALLAMSDLQRQPEELRHRLKIAGFVSLVLLVIGIPVVLFVLANMTNRSDWTPAESFNNWMAVVGVGAAFVFLFVMLCRWLFGDGSKLRTQVAADSAHEPDSQDSDAMLPMIWVAAFAIGMVPMFAAGQVSAYPDLAILGMSQAESAALLRIVAIACWCLIPGIYWLWKEANSRPRVARDLQQAADAGPENSPRGQISLKQSLWPLLVTSTALGILGVLIVGDGNTRGLETYPGFCVLHLAVMFALCSAFRAAWNSPSWIPWLATFLFLPFVGNVYLLAAANQSTAYGVQCIYVLQAVLALVLWFGLVFVRPIMSLNSGRRMSERLTGWQQIIAVTASLVIGAPLTLVVVYFAHFFRSGPIDRPIDAESRNNRSDYSPTDDPARPLKPEMALSESGSPMLPDPAAGMSIPGPPRPLQGNEFAWRTEAATATPIPESLKPLQGRWVVVSTEGAELGSPAVIAEAVYEAGGMSGAPGQAAAFGGGGPGYGDSSAESAPPMQWISFTGNLVEVYDGQTTPLLASFDLDQVPHRIHLSNPQQTRTGMAKAWRLGIFRLERDRLIICWTVGGYRSPQEFHTVKNDNKQLLVLRREWNPSPDEALAGSPPPRAVIPFTAHEAKSLQEAWARSANVPVETTNSLGMKLRVIPPGSFDLAEFELFWTSFLASGNVPTIASSLSQPIYLATQEVTVAQFRKFVEATKYETTAERLPLESGTERRTWQQPGIVQDSDQHPVVRVSWQDANAFCRWLSDTEQQQYRLPTIAEWAFAARAGLATKTSLKLPHNARLRFFDTTAPVGSDTANLFGLHDLFGNVSEWANDNLGAVETGGGFGGSPDGTSVPHGPVHHSFTVISLGGGYQSTRKRDDGSEWMLPQLLDQTAHRDDVGFRVVRVITRDVEVLSSYWPPVEELTATSTRAAIHKKTDLEKPSDPKLTPDDAEQKLPPGRPMIVLRGLVPSGSFPVASEIADIEIERVTFGDYSAPDINPSQLNAWSKVDLAKSLKLLGEFDVSKDPVPALLTHPVFTMPLPERTDGPWPAELVTHPLLPNSPPKSKYEVTHQLFRFIDFDVQPKHRYSYRVRLKLKPSSKEEVRPILFTPWSNPTDWIPFENPGPA